MPHNRRRTDSESGFALILALLSLLLLTTMGLALSQNSNIELQIATNQRYAEAARYNAEAGLEQGKAILMAMPTWTSILPPRRTATPDWNRTAWDTATTATTGQVNPGGTRGTRNFENWKCDTRGYGMGYGVVLDTGAADGAEEYRTNVQGVALNGAFTLWVRRPVGWTGTDASGATLQDYPSDDVLILTAEGVAPYAGANNTTALARANRAVYTLEVVLTRTGSTIMDESACSARVGQAGGSAGGGNTAGCRVMTGGGQITEALKSATGVGTGDLK